MKNSYSDIAIQYAQGVVGGKIDACKWVKLACQRQLNDLESAATGEYPYIWNPQLLDKHGVPYYPAERICAFAERLHHVKGKWRGQSIKLEPWQIFILTTIFGWIRKSDKSRRFREVYAEVPRKNSKSVLGAIIGLYMFCFDNEAGAEVYSGATSEKQAWEVFRPAKLMVKCNHELKEKFGITPNAASLVTNEDMSRFEPLIGNPGDGASPSCAIVDEYHEHRKPDQYNTMLSGMGARTQPLLIIITTAGTDLSCPCYDKREQVCHILNGVFENETVFGIIYTIDENDDWEDFAVWKKANPNFDVSIFADYLKEQLQTAKQQASQQNAIKCKHLNIWSNASIGAFNMSEWNKCKRSFDYRDFSGDVCFAGMDLASKIDITSLVFLFPKEDCFYILARHYLNELQVNLPENKHYKKWEIEGKLIVTPGARTDFSFIEEDLSKYSGIFKIDELIYDPKESGYLVQRLQESEKVSDEIEYIEFEQSTNKMSEPMKELEAQIYANTIFHNGDPVLTWMMSNVVKKQHKTGSQKKYFPSKERDRNKIDGAVALMMGLARAIVYRENVSRYESEGIRSL